MADCTDRKGKNACELRIMGHTLTDNRKGMVVNVMVTSRWPRQTGDNQAMINDARHAHEEESTLTLGADKGYDAPEFIDALHQMNVLPHVAQKTSGANGPYPMRWRAARATPSRIKCASESNRALAWTRRWGTVVRCRCEGTQQLSALLDGYEQVRDFDRAELNLIEPLRTLRLIHYSAWLARRWEDPIFPINFPWFGTPDYWRGQVLMLQEQVEQMQEAGLSV